MNPHQSLRSTRKLTLTLLPLHWLPGLLYLKYFYFNLVYFNTFNLIQSENNTCICKKMNLISMLLVAVHCSFKKCRYMNYKNGATVYVGWVQCFLMAKYSCSRNQKWSYNITGWMTRMVKLGPNLDTASYIDQKGHFFEKKKKRTPKISPPLFNPFTEWFPSK